MTSSEDLKPAPLPAISWEKGTYVESLGTIYDHIRNETDKAIRWYLLSKVSKRRLGRLCRSLIILMAFLAGIIPMIAQITGSDGEPAVQPILASIALAIGAGLLALDRFFGFSSAWMRYIRASHELKTALDRFQFEWEIRKVRWTATPPDAEDVIKALSDFQAFFSEVDGIVGSETNEWIVEFRGSLEMVAELIKDGGTRSVAKPSTR